jgi:hypothetical protein
MIKKLLFSRKLVWGVFIISLLCLPTSTQAQSIQRQSISSYGGSVISGTISFMQTAGQPYGTTGSYGEEASILQGFQQPVVFTVENIDPEPLKSLNLNVYPNPANYYITLESREVIENSFIQVTDMQGNIILSHHVANLHAHIINCNTWANGIYFITVTDGNQIKSSLKLIIKK